ncbi:MAG: efflux RND transporter periplasmic adaptor subunit [Burkholderiaceae bacterium]
MQMNRPTLIAATVAIALISALTLTLQAEAADDTKAPAAAAVKPALTVNVTQAQSGSFPVRISGSGSIAAWQEASVGTEANGLRLNDVKVNVGDVVKRGQVLATFSPDTVQADLAQIRASVAEAEATLAEAAGNAQRARELDASGALSAQQINQYLTLERTAQARLNAQKALLQTQQLRLRQTQVVAPDAGVISARSATVGAVLPAGQELFRLIRQGRLEWRGEVASNDLARINPGMTVNLVGPSGQNVVGKVRMVAPTVDATTRNGLVYVDLPAGTTVRAGMFARGDFELGNSPALTLPQSAVVLRDGFSYVYTVAENNKVSQVKVQAGRRVGDRVEITGGLNAKDRVVAAGAGFLGDGDTVKVVDSAAAPAAVTPIKKP